VENQTLSVFVALGAGLLSFLSPCVLPVLPSFLSYITGQSGADLKSGKAPKAMVLARTGAFVLGFSAVFTLAGFLIRGSAEFLGDTSWLAYASGAVVILLGLTMIFDIFKFLNFEKRFHVKIGEKASGAAALAGAALLGMAFGAGWSPCIGPILGSILAMAAQSTDPGQAVLLLVAYSIGLGLPFVAGGLFLSRLTPFFDWIKRRGGIVRAVSGILLMLIGVAMLFGKLGEISGAASQAGWWIADTRAADPLLIALLFGLPVLAVAAFVAAWPFFRRKSPTALGWIVAGVLAAIAALELTGVLPYSALLSAWFTFAGV
jgi:cytochrome c-type biogenesis protein